MAHRLSFALGHGLQVQIFDLFSHSQVKVKVRFSSCRYSRRSGRVTEVEENGNERLERAFYGKRHNVVFLQIAGIGDGAVAFGCFL